LIWLEEAAIAVRPLGAAGMDVGVAEGVAVGVGVGVAVGVGVGVGAAPPSWIMVATEGTPLEFKMKSM
jgi:hypothetical protein